MQKSDESVCVYGAGILQKNLTAFQEEIAGVRLAEDIEFIHRMRVASRRLRSALPLFINCYKKNERQTWQNDIQAITRALGSARDIDVQIELVSTFLSTLEEEKFKPGVRRLLLRLNQKRQRLQTKVVKALDRLENDGVIQAMQSQTAPLVEKTGQVYLFSPGLYQLSFDSVASALDHFLSYEPFISEPEHVEELHAMRIAAKQLRYTLEIFSALYPGGLKQYLQIMKQVQDLLGAIHDYDVWGFFLPGFISEESNRIRDFYGSNRSISRLVPGLEFFLSQTRAMREQKFLEFNQSWRKWAKDKVWPSLRQTIHTSFLEAAPLPPDVDNPETTLQEPIS